MKKLFLLLLMIFTTESFATGIGNVATAPCDNDTLSKYTGTANVEINWEPNTINLNWYDGDTKLTVANNAQSCVYDGTLTVPTQPTKPGYTFNGWKVIKVPGGFTALEYLESSGTQYINTGHTHAANETYEIDVMIDSVDKSYRAIIGAGPDGESGRLYVSKHSLTGEWFCNALISTTVVPLQTRVVIKLTQTGNTASLYVGGVLKQRAHVTIYGYPLMLLARNDWEPPTIGKLYGAKVFDSTNNLVQNFIPARRNSDGVLGMYDSISGNFFTNAGTGSFIAGPNAQ